jgi:hypothetical protein
MQLVDHSNFSKVYDFEIRVPCTVALFLSLIRKGTFSVGRQHVAEVYIVIVFKGAHVPFVLRKRKEQ